MLDGTVRLADSRILGYSQNRDSNENTIFVFHGTPGSRILPFSYQLDKVGNGEPPLRIITLERPGYGISDAMPGRTLQSWVTDVEQLCDTLGIDGYSVVGISGGGPFALACAALQPHRVSKVAVLCGLGPIDSLGTEGLSEEEKVCLAGGESARQFVQRLIGAAQANPDAMVSYMSSQLSESEKLLVTRDLVPVFREFVVEAGRRPEGMLQDYEILASPWGIPLDAIQCKVQFWHSDADQTVPISHALYLSSQIRNVDVQRVEGASHGGTSLVATESVYEFLRH